MFISEAEFQTLEGVNNALERVYNKSVEDTLKLLPDIILGLIVQSKGVHSTFGEFKKAHPEFEGKEAELALVIEQLEIENGAISMPDLLKMVPGRMQDLAIEVPAVQAKTVEDVEKSANGFI